MKFSSKILSCNLSPIHKFVPMAVKAEQEGKKVYYLNVGQPDFPTPRAYFDALRNLEQRTLGYGVSGGTDVLRRAIADYYQKCEIELEKENILVTSGGTEALQIAFSCILDEGDEIIVPEPYYPNYHTFIRMAGGVIRPLRCDLENNFAFPGAFALEQCITPKTKAILLTSPGNPTGAIYSEEDLNTISQVAMKHDLFVISDEVYREFSYNGRKPVSILKMEHMADHAIVIDSISKRFSACGSRIGCLISRNHELLNQAMKWCQGRMCVSVAEEAAAAALYTTREEALNKVIDEYTRRRDVLVAGLSKIPGVRCNDPEGAFYVVAELPVADADQFQEWLLTEFSQDKETLMFAPGEAFYATAGLGKNQARFAFVLEEADLQRSMELLELALKKYCALT